jgi:hypothetical protein
MAGRKKSCVWDKLDAEQQEVGELIRKYFPANVTSDVLGDAVIHGGALQLVPEGFRWHCLFPGCKRPGLNVQPLQDAAVHSTRELKEHWRKRHKRKVCTRCPSGKCAVEIASSMTVGRHGRQGRHR